MSDMDRIRQEIAENERWLAEVCPRSAPLDTTRIRQAVRLVVQEEWLARQDPAAMSSAAMGRIKSAVRAEVASSSAGAGRVHRRWAWALGSMSAAAMIALVVFTAEAPVDRQVHDVAAVSLAATFGTLDELDAEFDAEISNLRDALGAIDGSNASNDDVWGSDWGFWSEDESSGT